MPPSDFPGHAALPVWHDPRVARPLLRLRLRRGGVPACRACDRSVRRRSDGVDRGRWRSGRGRLRQGDGGRRQGRRASSAAVIVRVMDAVPPPGNARSLRRSARCLDRIPSRVSPYVATKVPRAPRREFSRNPRRPALVSKLPLLRASSLLGKDGRRAQPGCGRHTEWAFGGRSVPENSLRPSFPSRDLQRTHPLEQVSGTTAPDLLTFPYASEPRSRVGCDILAGCPGRARCARSRSSAPSRSTSPISPSGWPCCCRSSRPAR